jgi:HlyD family secretion protein
VQNVVTYTAVIDVKNPELKLKPGMTANVTAIVAESRNVLKVPNAALRFRANGAGASGTSQDGAGRRSQVWKIEEKETLRPVQLTIGVTDGTHTEIISGDLKPGDAVATGQISGEAGNAKAGARNPMMPLSGGRGARR